LVSSFCYILFRSNETQITPEITTFPNGTVLDPFLIDPLGRTRIKKLKTKQWIPDDLKPKVNHNNYYSDHI